MKMRKLLILALPVLVFLTGAWTNPLQQKEKYPFSKWDAATKAKANTAKDVSYLTESEKQVIYLCNLARLNGKLFAETYLQQYIDEAKAAKTAYTASLFTDLKKLKPLEVFQPQKDLYENAKDHAIESGKKGTMGHQNYEARFKKYSPNYQEMAENCDYGNDEPLDIVMSLLIDEGVPDKGHRANILDDKLFSIGVSIATHSKHGFNAVMCFGDHPQ